MSLEIELKDKEIAEQNREKVEEFVEKNFSSDYLAKQIFGKENLTRRDRIKNYHGKIYVRSRFIKYVSGCAGNSYFGIDCDSKYLN